MYVKGTWEVSQYFLRTVLLLFSIACCCLCCKVTIANYKTGKKRAASVLKYQWNKIQDLTDDVIFG